MSSFVFILSLLTILGCSDFYYQEKTAVSVEQIVEKETVSDELFLTSVDAGEVIQLEIRGVETRNHFGKVYSKNHKSHSRKDVALAVLIMKLTIVVGSTQRESARFFTRILWEKWSKLLTLRKEENGHF